MSGGIAEGTEAAAWISQMLEESSQLMAVDPTIGTRVFYGIAPEDAKYPFITLDVMSANDFYGLGNTIFWSDMLILVKATTTGRSTEPLRGIVSAIQDTLQWQRGETAYANIESCARERPYAPPPEVDDAGAFSSLGAEYRIRVRSKGYV
jgi:hypothetical protein